MVIWYDSWILLKLSRLRWPVNSKSCPPHEDPKKSSQYATMTSAAATILLNCIPLECNLSCLLGKWQQETAIFFPLRGALTRERKHQLQSRGNRKWRWHSSFVVFQPYIESLQLVNACHYSKETVSRQLHSQKEKNIICRYPKGEFQLVSVLNEGVCVALYKFDGTAACCNVGSMKCSQLSTPKHSPISLNLSLPHVVFLTMEEECEDDDNPFPSSSAGGERKYPHPTLVTNCSNCTTEVFWKSILFKTWTSAIWLKWKHWLIYKSMM